MTDARDMASKLLDGLQELSTQADQQNSLAPSLPGLIRLAVQTRASANLALVGYEAQMDKM